MPTESAMNGGIGTESYAKNSRYQGGAVETAKEIITEGINKNLDIEKLSSTSVDTFRIADFGCSTGPNTFIAIQTIVEAVRKKFETELSDSRVPEFQVFFNDRISNDFNTLFASLPPERKYYAAGVPGSFYERQFPKDSLHFAHSSCTLNWLSVMPQEILDNSSPAWNQGKITYSGEKKEVLKAYALQYAKDLDSFFKARAQELVCGGLMAILVPTVPNPNSDLSSITFPSYDLLGTCLIELAERGRFDAAKVDSFNLPLYYTYPNELKAIIEKNQDFSIERIEVLNVRSKHQTDPDPKAFSLAKRAVFEGLLQEHFGNEFMDELFDLYAEKIKETAVPSNPKETSMITFVLVKRVLRMT
ncbi:probable S-adenosylmethionine-dependent methyltransferase At5g37990 [Olea europaea subsp. europaea]|uniref:Probable S-adenosylmethionine-dependent methyltransferase At5g37990 n=2 Tax=Olea europaea subsp. europaea TaxID=158383 RepID=A0A8S0Q3Q9_OLEEU|nr:probable S-adenosylmethionine-dependent methyltransferase At5g37990 [Olea europaea subsp. europaea]